MGRVGTVGILAFVVLVGCFSYPDDIRDTSQLPLHSPTIPSPQNSPVWLTRMKELDQISGRGNIDLVFLGDSITQGWEPEERPVWDRYYAKRMSANFGVNRDTTQNLLWRIQHGNLQGMRPHLLILLIGVNNTSRGTSAQEIAEGVEAVVHNLRIALPQTKLLILEIFPSGEYPDGPRRLKSREANVLMREIVDGKMSFFLDISDVFLNKDGTISPTIMPDFLHLSLRGYQLWAEAI